MRELGQMITRRRRAVAPTIVLVAAAATATGCAAPAGGIEVRDAQGATVLVAAAPAGAGQPQAALEGTLLVDPATGCLAVEAGGEITGPVLPHGAELTPNGLVLGSGAAPLALDAPVVLGGGSRSREDLPSGTTTTPCDYAADFTANPPE